jgi:quercetin dioxygenase-like cupin family protein
MPWERVNDAIARRLVTGERIMLAQVRLEKGAVVPSHRHVHEQMACILEGALQFRIGEDREEERTLRAGEVLHLPSNVLHEATVLETALVLDVFSPPREDWLDGSDTYLRGR